MRLQTDTKDVQRVGVAQSSEFSIKATAKAFGILSSGLYSDKILAIVRELSCNAYDSHVAAGRKDVPIEVKLPTALEPTFYVKDYGVGLDHEGVIGLYTTYFDSTKTDSNDFIGALGLGSKSPFSYTNNFTVEARFNGVKRLYAAIINENGVPEINLQGEQKTNEPNGMTISLAAKRDDAAKFLEAAQKAFMYFTPVPNVLGYDKFQPRQFKYTVSGTNWKMRDENSDGGGARVVQGFVSYPIDGAQLRSHGLSDLGGRICGLNIDFFVPIGEVEVAASREALSYNKHTIENLKLAIGYAEKEMRAAIQKQIDDCPTLWDARQLHVKLANWRSKTHSIYDSLSKQRPFTYKSTPITDTFKLDLSTIGQTQLQIVYRQHWGKHRIRTSGEWSPTKAAKLFEFAVREGMTVLVDDTFKSKQALPLYLAGKPRQSGGDDNHCLVIKPLGKNLYSALETQAILQQLGLTATAADYVSKLPLPAKVTKQYTYKARKSDEALLWRGFPENGGYKKNQLRRVFSRLCWTGEQINMFSAKEEQFYVEVDRFSIMRGEAAQTSFDNFLEQMKEVGALRKDMKVYGLTEKQVRLIKKNKMWLNVFDEAKRRFNEINNTNVLTNRVISDRVLNAVGEGIARHVVTNWTTLAPKIVNGSFKTIVNKIADVTDAGKSCKFKIDDILAASKWVAKDFQTEVNKQYTEIVEEFKLAMEKHAMLKLVDWNRVGLSDLDMIVDYVKYVAKK